MTRTKYTEVFTAVARRPEWRHPRPGPARPRPASGSGSQAGSEESEPEIKVGFLPLWTCNLDSVLLKLLITDLVSELGAGLGHEVGVNPGVEAAAGINAKGVTLLWTRATQHRDQPLVLMFKCTFYVFGALNSTGKNTIQSSRVLFLNNIFQKLPLSTDNKVHNSKTD